MNILFQHDGILPVKKYGGTERIIFWHMKELVRQGHRVFLLGHPKSQVTEHNIELIPKIETDDGNWRRQVPNNIDIIHLFYTPPEFLNDLPLLVTIEGHGQPGEKFYQNTVFISAQHAKNHNSSQFVYNGIDLSEYPFCICEKDIRSKTSKDYWQHFLFLAKAKWKVKNLAACVAAAKKTGKHLHIGGGRVFSFSPYLHSYGMVNQQQKISLLKKVSALLFPVRWPEPFGIAIIEAYAMGIPVIGSPYGSLPELIPPATGIICHNQLELESALKGPPRDFDPYQIRDYVEKNFSINKMTHQYLQLYERVVKGEKLNPTPPVVTLPHSPEKLLPF